MIEELNPAQLQPLLHHAMGRDPCRVSTVAVQPFCKTLHLTDFSHFVQLFDQINGLVAARVERIALPRKPLAMSTPAAQYTPEPSTAGRRNGRGHAALTATAPYLPGRG